MEKNQTLLNDLMLNEDSNPYYYKGLSKEMKNDLNNKFYKYNRQNLNDICNEFHEIIELIFNEFIENLNNFNNKKIKKLNKSKDIMKLFIKSLNLNENDSYFIKEYFKNIISMLFNNIISHFHLVEYEEYFKKHKKIFYAYIKII